MRTLNKEVAERMPKLYSTDGQKQREVQVVFKHISSRWTWLIVEGEQQEDGDWLLYGYVYSGLGEDCDEWGYVMLSELMSVPEILQFTYKKNPIIDSNGEIVSA